MYVYTLLNIVQSYTHLYPYIYICIYEYTLAVYGCPFKSVVMKIFSIDIRLHTFIHMHVDRVLKCFLDLMHQLELNKIVK